jgi:hypothetical protein
MYIFLWHSDRNCLGTELSRDAKVVGHVVWPPTPTFFGVGSSDTDTDTTIFGAVKSDTDTDKLFLVLENLTPTPRF